MVNTNNRRRRAPDEFTSRSPLDSVGPGLQSDQITSPQRHVHGQHVHRGIRMCCGLGPQTRCSPQTRCRNGPARATINQPRTKVRNTYRHLEPQRDSSCGIPCTNSVLHLPRYRYDTGREFQSTSFIITGSVLSTTSLRASRHATIPEGEMIAYNYIPLSLRNRCRQHLHILDSTEDGSDCTGW